MILGKKIIEKLIREGKLVIEPLSHDTIRENGIDLRIGDEHAYVRGDVPVIDLVAMSDSDLETCYVKKRSEYIVIPPRGFVLLTTLEYVKLPDNVVGLCNLRSTLARAGLAVPPTVIDAGFEGTLTIEVVNNSPVPIALRRGMRFLHVVLVWCDGAVPYRGKYLGQRGVRLPKSLREEAV